MKFFAIEPPSKLLCLCPTLMNASITPVSSAYKHYFRANLLSGVTTSSVSAGAGKSASLAAFCNYLTLMSFIYFAI